MKEMNQVITEKGYLVRTIWGFKSISPLILVASIFLSPVFLSGAWVTAVIVFAVVFLMYPDNPI